LILANRYHIAIVVAEMQKDVVDKVLWKQAIEQSRDIESLVLPKYIKIRAELIAKEEGFPNKRK
jgi:hypothetical protein